jgi:hypothetical protein
VYLIFRVNSVYCTLHEARFIIFFHDSNCDGVLNYSEFLNLIISGDDHYLRRIAKARLGYTYNSYMLPYDVEYSVCKVLEKELELIRGLEIILSDVKARFDFKAADVFNSLDCYGLNYLNSDK